MTAIAAAQDRISDPLPTVSPSAHVVVRDLSKSFSSGRNSRLTALMRGAHDLCDEHGDVATASLLENWIDETERRVWFLRETVQPA